MSGSCLSPDGLSGLGLRRCFAVAGHSVGLRLGVWREILARLRQMLQDRRHAVLDHHGRQDCCSRLALQLGLQYHFAGRSVSRLSVTSMSKYR